MLFTIRLQIYKKYQYKQRKFAKKYVKKTKQ